MNNRSCIEALENRSMFSADIRTVVAVPVAAPGHSATVVNRQFSVQATSLSTDLSSIRSQYGVPSLTAAILKNGKISSEAAVGVRQAGTSTAVTINDKYLLGSATKAMTATLAAKLVERGYIKWTTRIADVFPGLGGAIAKTYGNVTLAQLLANRSGLPEDPPTDVTIGLALDSAAKNGMKARNDYLRGFLKLKPVVKVGNYSYSNVGYMVAGAMMETVMRESYEAMMTRLVFKPLGMSSATFGWPGSSSTLDEPRPTSASGTSKSPDAIDRFPAAFNPSGGAAMNIGDWAKFVGIQLGQVPKGFLTKDSIKTLRTPYGGKGSTYALGWNIVSAGFQDYTLLQHDGTDGYWYASVLASKDTGKAILVLTNRGGTAGAGAAHAVIKKEGSKLVSTSDVVNNIGDVIKHFF